MLQPGPASRLLFCPTAFGTGLPSPSRGSGSSLPSHCWRLPVQEVPPTLAPAPELAAAPMSNPDQAGTNPSLGCQTQRAGPGQAQRCRAGDSPTRRGWRRQQPTAPPGAISYRCIFTTGNPKKCWERQDPALPHSKGRGCASTGREEAGEERPPFLLGDQRAESSPGPRQWTGGQHHSILAEPHHRSLPSASQPRRPSSTPGPP